MSSRPPTRDIPKTPFRRPSSSLLSAGMGLTITPYRVQTAFHSDSSQRYARLHQRPPLRALNVPMSLALPSPLQINPRSMLNRPVSAEVEHRQFRRQALLSSPSLVTDDLRRTNVNLNQDFRPSTSVLHYRLHQRSHSILP